MKYVIGIDLGTSSMKILLINQEGKVCNQVSRNYDVHQIKSGYSEQNCDDWIIQAKKGLKEIVDLSNVEKKQIEGISFSGQMHSLVLVDRKFKPLRPSILWNDTRTTEQCNKIKKVISEKKFIKITQNKIFEGSTLPKLLWVKENEPDIYNKATMFMLPKDYLRFRMTGEVHTDYSDAAGTLLFDVIKKEWSKEICEKLNIDINLCPPVLESYDHVGFLTEEWAQQTGLSEKTKIFTGGADNACGAIGAGILSQDKTLCSIGTSGVILSYEERKDSIYQGSIHHFNHVIKNAYYIMGVTLGAGYSLNWFKRNFSEEHSYEELLESINSVPVGSKGLMFTPYLNGERMPHDDSSIRGSFIGINSSHTKKEFIKAIIEGITFSLNELIEIMRHHKHIDTIISIGGGAKSQTWLQIQADIFNAKIQTLSSEQGPAFGAAIISAYGCGWFASLEEATANLVEVSETFIPNKKNVNKYKDLFEIYKSIYLQTKDINKKLEKYRG